MVILLIGSFSFYKLWDRAKKDDARQTENVKVLNSNYKSYKAAYKNGLKTKKGQDSVNILNVAQIKALTYTVSDLKDYNSAAVQLIKDLNLKLKNVQNVSDITINTNQNIHTPTIMKGDSLKCFDFSDMFLKLSGCAGNKGTDIKYNLTDSLFAVIDMVKAHNFLFFHWGNKVSGLTAVSKNPNSHITGLKFTVVKH
jgi:hypothetical protein